MKGKLITVLVLAAILVFTVYRMMLYESSKSSQKKVLMLVEDESKPLVDQLNLEDLKSIAGKADYYFRAEGDYFSRVKENSRALGDKAAWERIYIKGVNLGVAVPGKFPAEFSLTFDQYLEWFRLIGEMNANIIRTYTILPPVFYEAFAYYNLHYHNNQLFLMQGVWTEVPANENYYETAYTRSFQKEIVNVIDVIHGRAVLEERPGKASGVYSTDVSSHVAALLLGREWEPGGVHKTNILNNITKYTGNFVCMNDGNAMEAWLASMLDFSVLYETQAYGFQHPVSFVNWLPLDPMHHETEIIESKKVREYDNDLESIDFSRFHSTELFMPGIFAAYHAYPYYPDFIYLQESYRPQQGERDKGSSYRRYLQDLKQHTPGMPLVIAEYGLPSSRGNSHFSDFGHHQGGHSEKQQASLSMELTRDIAVAGCAGAIYFEWIDEWFKHNWLVMDFETPEEDRKIWHNMENPEQNFGIMAMENKIRRIDASLEDWPGRQSGKTPSILTAADATYFYVAIEAPGFDLAKNNLYIAFDTYDKEKGDHKLPFIGKTFPNGFEFLAEFKSSNNAAILVDEPYSVFTDIESNIKPIVGSVNNSNGRFIRQILQANRGRTSLKGKKTPPKDFDRSTLQFGRSADPSTSNADWYYDAKKGIIEIRLDWHLLNVCDPAKHFVLDDKAGTRQIEYVKTKGFKILAFVTDKWDKVLAQYPGENPHSFLWESWDVPDYSPRLKPLYFALRENFRNDPTSPVEVVNAVPGNKPFKIAPFYNNRKAAISLSFDESAWSQYQYGAPLLEKYGFPANFGVFLNPAERPERETEGAKETHYKLLGLKEIKELSQTNEIALQLTGEEVLNKADFFSFSRKMNANVSCVHVTGTANIREIPKEVLFARGMPGMTEFTTFNGVKSRILSPENSIGSLDSILKQGIGEWSILVYRHFYGEIAEIKHLDVNERKFYTRQEDFEKQLRLYRNTDYWIASEGNVFRYMTERNASTIHTEQFKNLIFVKVLNTLNPKEYQHPLTLIYETAARRIRVKGSESDGTYINRNGRIIFNVVPQQEVTIEILE